MNRVYRIIGLSIVGAGVGIWAPLPLVTFLYGYDHGHQTEQVALWTIPFCTICGMLIAVFGRQSKATKP